ncbi:MAG: PhnB protein [Gammaproteobacteria bacterium]|jgi:PhnB protein
MHHGVLAYNNHGIEWSVQNGTHFYQHKADYGESYDMSKKVSPIPRSYRTATPCLTVINIDSAVAFYQAAFGAEVLSSHLSADDSTTVHATIKIGNSMVVLNLEAPEQGILSPVSSGFSAGQIHLYVDDIDASWNRAVEAGAEIRNPLYDAYWGDRTGMLADNHGHLWSIASKIENVSKEEVKKRVMALNDDLEAPYIAETAVSAQ